jgi:hypothetical protein
VRPSQPFQDPREAGYTHSMPFAPETAEPLYGVTVPSRPVYIPPDPLGVLQESHAAHELLAHDTLVVVRCVCVLFLLDLNWADMNRQIEMLNIFMGFEQANRYAIQTPNGEVVGL